MERGGAVGGPHGRRWRRRRARATTLCGVEGRAPRARTEMPRCSSSTQPATVAVTMAHACADSKLKRNHAPKTSDTVALEWPTPIVIIDSRKMTSMQNEATRAPTRRTVGPAASLPIRYATVPAPTTWSVDATVRPAVSSACRWKSVFSAAESVKSPPTFASMISASRRCESASHSRRRGASARRGSRSPEVSVFMVSRGAREGEVAFVGRCGVP